MKCSIKILSTAIVIPAHLLWVCGLLLFKEADINLSWKSETHLQPSKKNPKQTNEKKKSFVLLRLNKPPTCLPFAPKYQQIPKANFNIMKTFRTSLVHNKKKGPLCFSTDSESLLSCCGGSVTQRGNFRAEWLQLWEMSIWLTNLKSRR